MGNTEVRHDTGYGLVPRRIMRDETLSVTAKTVYCYLASFAGNTGRSFPSTGLMAKELNLSKNTLFKYLKELRDKGVVTVEREVCEGNKFGRNIYYLNNKVEKKEDKEPCTKFSDMENPYTENPYTRECDTNSNSFNSNNLNNNNTISPTEVEPEEEENLKKKDLDKIIAKWNDNTKGKIRPIRAINRNTNRYKQLNARCKESSLAEVLEGIGNISKSKFLQGYNDRGWVIDFDWYIKPSNYIKVLEGNFTDTKPAKAKVKRDFTFTGEGY